MATFTITKKALKDKENMAKLLLEVSGIDPDQWLASKYDEVIQENMAILSKGVALVKQQGKGGDHR